MGTISYKKFYRVVVLVTGEQLFPPHQIRWPLGKDFGAIDNNPGVQEVQEALNTKTWTCGRERDASLLAGKPKNHLREHLGNAPCERQQ